METLPTQLTQLATSLRILPGVGNRTAMRMALFLVEKIHHSRAQQLSQDIQVAIDGVRICDNCRHFAGEKLCAICTSLGRDNSLLCVVESPTDLVAIESSGSYRGRYFVLHGKLSPIDGIGPEQLGLDLLESLVSGKLNNNQISEVILALGTTVEGNVTCYYLQRRLKPSGVKITRPAQGIPSGGNVEMLDGTTLGQALQGRSELT